MDWIVLLPPVLAIVLALWTRQVYLALIVGLWLGTTILQDGNPIAGLRELGDQIVLVFQDAGNTRVILFCLLVGGLVALVQASGGVAGFIAWAQQRGLGRTRRSAEVLAWAVGMIIFVESSITCLVVGAVSRPFFDRLQLPREKLAYYCDATSAPVCMMIPLNGWGAYVLGLLAAQGVVSGAVVLLAESLLYNFYCILVILFTLLLAVSGWGFGAMRRAEVRASKTGDVIRPGARPLISEEITELKPLPGAGENARNLLIPLSVMVVMIFVGLWITGEGDITQGSGSTAVFWAVGIAIVAAMVLYAFPRKSHGGRPVMKIGESTDLVLRGSAGLVGVTVLIVLAFALGQVSRELEMGPYLVGMVGSGRGAWWMPALIFLVAGFISFTLGSSWATFAILIPIALPLASGLDMPLALFLGAVLSGGVFGDHASPLSDTTIISSMSAACDHVDHVNTQLPYALLMAVCSLIGFLIAGAIV